VIGAETSLLSINFIGAVAAHAVLAVGAVCCLRKALPKKPEEAPQEGGAS
jgi:hypothetical protein